MDSESQSRSQYEAKLKALHLHANKLADAKSIEEIGEHTSDAMVNTLRIGTIGWGEGTLSIVEGNFLVSVEHAGQEMYRMPLDGPGISVRAVRTGETQLVNDTRNDADFVGVVSGEETWSKLDDNWRERVVVLRESIGGKGALSELDVPVKIDDTVVALINAQSKDLNAFTEHDQELLEVLASHVASAIQRIRLLEDKDQYEDKLIALHQHANLLSKASTINEIADYTVNAQKNTLGIPYAGFHIVQNDALKRIMDDRAPHVAGPSQSNGIISFTQKSIMVRAAKTGKTQFVPDTREDDDYLQGALSLIASLSEIDVPVIVDGKVVAVLNSEEITLNAFTEGDQLLLETLASHVASAIQRIRLLEDKDQYEAKLEALHMHANKLADAKTLMEIASYTKDALENTVRPDMIDFGSIAFVDGNLVTYRSSTGPELPIDGPGIITRAVRTGETQIVPDTRKDVDFIGINMDEGTWARLDERERKRQEKYRELGEEPVLSEVAVPVKIGDAVVAALDAESTELDAFTEYDVKLLETLAGHIASSIQRIRTKEEVRQLAYRLNNLELGGCYLSDSHERCLKAYAVLSMEGVPGLCIVREDPQRLVDNYGIKKEEIVLLSSRPFEEYETLDDLQSLSRALSRFLESGEGVVLLDGLEYLISRFGFESVYSFVQEKRFDFLRSKAVLLVPLDMETVEGREKALLSSEFTMLE